MEVFEGDSEHFARQNARKRKLSSRKFPLFFIFSFFHFLFASASFGVAGCGKVHGFAHFSMQSHPVFFICFIMPPHFFLKSMARVKPPTTDSVVIAMVQMGDMGFCFVVKNISILRSIRMYFWRIKGILIVWHGQIETIQKGFSLCLFCFDFFLWLLTNFFIPCKI